MAAINDKLQEALNGQINAELFSSYLYLSMSAYFESQDLPGFANWMRVQAREEDFHVQKFFDYIIERGGKVALKAIEAPPSQWDSPLAVFEATLEHEQKVTGLVNNLVYVGLDFQGTGEESVDLASTGMSVKVFAIVRNCRQTPEGDYLHMMFISRLPESCENVFPIPATEEQEND